MIICHPYRFIFLKTRKTAGTSIELALSELCGPADIITSVGGEEDERLRRGRPPQNFIIRCRKQWWQRWWPLRSREPRHFVFYNHMPAWSVRRHVDRAVWENYTKVATVRNPWDREVSRFYWSGRYPNFEEYIVRRSRRNPINNYRIHSIRGKNIADVVLRYENLAEDFAEFVRSLGVNDVPELLNAKSAKRPSEARDYRALYNDRTRAIVARVYAREIREFGYEF